MLKLKNTTQTSLVANQIIPLNLDKQTNNKIVYANNGGQVNIGGIVNIDAMFAITSTGAGTITVQLYNGTTPVPGVFSTYNFAAAGSIKTFNINDSEIVVNTPASARVNFNFVVSGACTLEDANVVFAYKQ